MGTPERHASPSHVGVAAPADKCRRLSRVGCDRRVKLVAVHRAHAHPGCRRNEQQSRHAPKRIVTVSFQNFLVGLDVVAPGGSSSPMPLSRNGNPNVTVVRVVRIVIATLPKRRFAAATL